MEFASVDPATGERFAAWPVADAQARDRLLERAAAVFEAGYERTPAERAGVLRGVAAELSRRREELAAIATREMGKPLAEARAEVDKCAAACTWFAEHGPGLLADEPHPSDASDSWVSYLPLGVIFAVMPWNFPYWQVFRHAAPAVMAGNAIVVKHAENTLGAAHAIDEVFRTAGAPDLVSTLVVTVEDSAAVIRDPRVAAVTLTGSARAGSAVAATAGEVRKKTVLELGGSDAFVVLDDADVAAAAATAVRARFQNTGQSCIAAKRFIVQRSVAPAFTDAFVDAVKGLRLGDPTGEVDLGPMARGDLRDQLTRQFHASVAGGARVLLDGGPQQGPGFFFAPVVLELTGTDVPAWREETFGPLAPILVVDTESDALAAANDSDYGLGGNVWTADLERGRAFARRMRTGAVFVNGMTASQPGLPFGGIKNSGYGRELARVGVREFTDQQTVWVGPARKR